MLMTQTFFISLSVMMALSPISKKILGSESTCIFLVFGIQLVHQLPGLANQLTQTLMASTA